MNYESLVSESLEHLTALEKAQKLVRYQQRVRFLRLLKSGAEKTKKAAGAKVGWQLRFSQQMWRLYREQGLSALLEKPPKRSLGKLSCLEISQMQRYLREFGRAVAASCKPI